MLGLLLTVEPKDLVQTHKGLLIAENIRLRRVGREANDAGKRREHQHVFGRLSNDTKSTHVA